MTVLSGVLGSQPAWEPPIPAAGSAGGKGRLGRTPWRIYFGPARSMGGHGERQLSPNDFSRSLRVGRRLVEGDVRLFPVRPSEEPILGRLLLALVVDSVHLLHVKPIHTLEDAADLLLGHVRLRAECRGGHPTRFLKALCRLLGQRHEAQVEVGEQRGQPPRARGDHFHRLGSAASHGGRQGKIWHREDTRGKGLRVCVG
mmetsp:Transcript_41593/g.105361  ORF Transcript_41593/g.105361 Transcript_41593/m.105361 type:complete len:200 (-) Transcript_41593:65-664(-)